MTLCVNKMRKCLCKKYKVHTRASHKSMTDFLFVYISFQTSTGTERSLEQIRQSLRDNPKACF
jgi:hypothetical protein